MRKIRIYILNMFYNIPIIISSLAVYGLVFIKGLQLRLYIGIAFLFVCEAIFLCTKRIDYKSAKNNKTNCAVSLMILLSLFISFYYRWTDGGLPLTKFINEHNISTTMCLLLLGAALCLVAATGVLYACNIALPVINYLKNVIVKRNKEFFTIFIIYLLGIMSLVRANYMYRDDMGRVFNGYSILGGFSRYLSEYISNTLHTSAYLSDISPLTQILAVLIMAVSAVIILDTFSKKDRYDFLSVAALIPVCLSPFFLMCLSYKYDAPDMALSVLLAVLPIAFVGRNTKKYAVLVFLCTIGVCTTYQSSSGIFPLLIIFLSLEEWKNGKRLIEIIKKIAVSSISYVAGVLVFRLFVMDPYIDDNAYVDTRVNGNLITNVKNNIMIFSKYIVENSKPILLFLIAVTLISFIFVVLKTTKKGRIITLLLTVVSLLLMYVVSFGAYILINNPLVKGRSIFALGILLSLLFVEIANERMTYFGKGCVLAVGLFVFVFAFTYGNALCVQKEYTEFRIHEVLDDLKNIEKMETDDEKIVQIKGDIGFAPAVENMMTDNPMLNDLMYTGFKSGEEDPWSVYEFKEYYNLNNIICDAEGRNLENERIPKINETIYHTLYGKGNYYIVELKNYNKNSHPKYW